VFPVLLLIDGTCGGVKASRIAKLSYYFDDGTLAALRVTFGAERRSMPFFWFNARMTT
jgi:hypothetical protein